MVGLLLYCKQILTPLVYAAKSTPAREARGACGSSHGVGFVFHRPGFCTR